MRSPKYEAHVEYTSSNGYYGDFIAHEDLKTDALLLLAKMIGFYQGRSCRIINVVLTDLRTNENISLPRGLYSLY